MSEGLTFTDKEALWLEKITKYYTVTKEIIIFAEQVDPQNRTLPQTINELRNCLDHLMRVVSVKFGLRAVASGDGDDDYIQTNLDKAYGHVYRAAYDTLDWLSLTLKDRIIAEMQEFSLETVHDVMPEYFTEIKPKMEQLLSYDIANLGAEKDVEAQSEENLVKYGRIAAELKQLFQGHQ